MKTFALIQLLNIGLVSGSATLRQVRNNNPYLSPKYSEKVAESIDKHAASYGIPSNIVAAIFMVESAYKVNAVNTKSNDYGIGQINEFNIKAYKLDKLRLLSDMNYSVKWGIHVFSWFYKRYPLDVAIMRYNCGTRPSCIKIRSVRSYLRKVKQYM